jgi:hypothetical protein
VVLNENKATTRWIDHLYPLLTHEPTVQPPVVSKAPVRRCRLGQRLAIESGFKRWVVSRIHQPQAKILRPRPSAELRLDSLTAVELIENLAS